LQITSLLISRSWIYWLMSLTESVSIHSLKSNYNFHTRWFRFTLYFMHFSISLCWFFLLLKLTVFRVKSKISLQLMFTIFANEIVFFQHFQHFLVKFFFFSLNNKHFDFFLSPSAVVESRFNLFQMRVFVFFLDFFFISCRLLCDTFVL
jgi:hypothetical protein